MKIELSKMLAFATIAAFIGLSAGCATTQELEKVKQQLDQVEQTANSASSTANRAQAEASAASATADEAKNMAEESAACCVSTNERIDRMFNEMRRK